MIAEKNIKSGPLLEIDYYHIRPDGNRIPERSAKEKRSTAEQEKYNRTQCTKKLIRIVNANFDSTDYLMHPTYDAQHSRITEAEARKDMVNYLRRAKTMRVSELKKQQKILAATAAALKRNPRSRELKRAVDEAKAKVHKLQQPFRYAYVIEKETYKTGKRAGTDNWHFHLFMTGGIDRDVLENMWPEGTRVNVDRFQPEKFGPDAAARYMSKSPEGSKRFVASRNCIKPEPKRKEANLTERTLERMAKTRVDDAEYWERKYRGYRFISCYPRFNTYNGHWYVSVIMYKKGGEAPPWGQTEWIT